MGAKERGTLKSPSKYYTQEEFLIEAMTSCGIRSPEGRKAKRKGLPMDVKYPYVMYSHINGNDGSARENIDIILPKTDTRMKKTSVAMVEDRFGLFVTWQITNMLMSPIRLRLIDEKIVSDQDGKLTALKRAGKALLAKHGSAGYAWATMYFSLEHQVVEKVVDSEIVDLPIEMEDGSIETYCFHMIELKRKEEPSPLHKINTSGRKL